jgi:hypothetical protein
VPSTRRKARYYSLVWQIALTRDGKSPSRTSIGSKSDFPCLHGVRTPRMWNPWRARSALSSVNRMSVSRQTDKICQLLYSAFARRLLQKLPFYSAPEAEGRVLGASRCSDHELILRGASTLKWHFHAHCE